MSGWDAIVVGAGPAGTLAAETLRHRGVRVLVIDAGPRPETRANIPTVDENDWRYESIGADVDWLRVRAVGGASLAWGGWCNRFPDRVFQRGAWPFDANELDTAYALVEKRIGVVPEPIGFRYQSCAQSLGLSLVQMHASRIRGQAWTGMQSPIADQVQTETIATSIETQGSRSCVLNVMVGRQKQQLPFKLLLLACSPVETARLLLASKLDPHCPLIGRGLTYHPVAGYALIEPPIDPPEPPTAALLVADDVTNTRPPLAYSVELTGPFEFRNLTPDLQARVELDNGPAQDTQITFIHCFGELQPHEHRYVDLNCDHLDALGRPVPRIHLAWSHDERTLIGAMQAAALDIAESIASADAQLVEYLDPVGAPMLFHEAGTCALGTSQDAPCDPLGRLRLLPNVWIADASVFPSAGDRHPTLTILAHATRAAAAAANSLKN